MKKRASLAKRIIITCLVLAVLAGAVAGGIYAWRALGATPVEVYPVQNLAIDYGYESSSTSGQVSAGKVQEVRMNGGLVNEVRVAPGDEVAVGDVLMVYDTESLKIAIQRDEARVGVVEAGIERDQREIARLSNLRPSEWAPEPTVETIDHGELTTRDVVDAGAQSDPEPAYDLLFRCTPTTKVTAAFLQELRASGQVAEFALYDANTLYGSWVVDGAALPATRTVYEPFTLPSPDEPVEPVEPDDPENPDEPAEGVDDEGGEEPSDGGEPEPEPEPEPTPEPDPEPAHAPDLPPLFTVREVEALDADWTLGDGVEMSGMGAVLASADGPRYGMLMPTFPTPYERYETIEHWPDAPSGDDYIYSRAELASMISALQEGLKSSDLDLRQAKLALEQDRLATETGEVRATVNGTVAQVKPVEEALEGDVLITVRGQDAYTITTYVDERSLADMTVGQVLSFFAYESGTGGTATVTEVGDVPATGGGWYGEANPNSSWYPVTATVNDADVNLIVSEYCEVTREQADDEEAQKGVFLQNMFIREGEGGNYVMAVGDDGRLERRRVGCGRQMWGEYTQITGGLSPTDKIAFPYGKAVVEGAPVEERDYPTY